MPAISPEPLRTGMACYRKHINACKGCHDQTAVLAPAYQQATIHIAGMINYILYKPQLD